MSTTFPQRVADPFIQIWKGQQFTLLPILVKFSIETVTGFKKLLRECLDMKPEVDLVHNDLFGRQILRDFTIHWADLSRKKCNERILGRLSTGCCSWLFHPSYGALDDCFCDSGNSMLPLLKKH